MEGIKARQTGEHTINFLLSSTGTNERLSALNCPRVLRGRGATCENLTFTWPALRGHGRGRRRSGRNEGKKERRKRRDEEKVRKAVQTGAW